ncbi:hypothetical protein [uncultured Nostoc sp.]|uniref:hypothetical protein n=1 Tax=uncultured Nostoc sp. TaxID=340711 RepID=UPI0035CC313D
MPISSFERWRCFVRLLAIASRKQKLKMLLKTSKQEILELMFLLRLPQWSDLKAFSSRYGILTYASTVYTPLFFVKLS